MKLFLRQIHQVFTFHSFIKHISQKSVILYYNTARKAVIEITKRRRGA